MRKLFLFVTTVVLFSFAFSFGGDFRVIRQLFPTDEIDFILSENSYLDFHENRYFLIDSKIVPIGKHTYEVLFKFRKHRKVKRKKILGIKVEIVTDAEETKLVALNFWYRGGRFLFIETPRGFIPLELSPKCYLKHEDTRLVPKYNTISRDFTINDYKFHLVFTFTRCEF
jgi:hypothetical protein